MSGAPVRNKQAWLEYLESVHPSDIEMGLGRVTEVAKRLDLFKPAPITIVVGGTNGKGTTTAFLGQLLAENNLTSACYNSPHIHEYNERVNRRDSISESRFTTDKELCAAFNAIEEGRGETQLTYFEFGTLAALWQIRQWNVDVALLEVGLGGRLDAVNIVDTDLAIVTSVGLDHQDWLGGTLDLIGYEKAGIARKNKPLICGQPDVAQGFIDHVQEIGANCLYQGEDFSIAGQSEGHIPALNIASAIAGLKTLDLLPSMQGVESAIKRTKVPGRLTTYACEYGGQKISFVLDVAHNGQAADYLSRQIKEADTAILAMLADKDPSAVVSALQSIKYWHLAGLVGYRGQTALELGRKIVSNLDTTKHKVECHISVYQAIINIIESKRFLRGHITAPIFIIGSFLTVSAAEDALKTIKGLTLNGN